MSISLEAIKGYGGGQITLQTVLSLVPFAIITLLCGLVGRAYYNVFLHPLHKVPGPWWYAASGLARFRMMTSGAVHSILHDLHEKYGDVVRVGPDEVSLAFPKAWSEVDGQKRVAQQDSDGPSYLENAKDKTFYAYVSHPSSIIRMEQAEHEQGRKQLGAAFSAKAVAEQEPLIQRHIDRLVELLRTVAPSTTPQNPIDMVRYINWALFDIIGDLGFGEPFGSLTDGQDHAWVDLIPETVKYGNIMTALHRLLGSPTLTKLAARIVVSSSLRPKMAWHRALSAEKVARRKAQGPGRPDFATPMLADPTFWTHERLQSTSTTLITAGSETMATTLSACVFYLTSQKNAGQPGSALHTLRDEIRTAFKSDADINFASVRDLPYLSAVVDEALRIHPAPATGFPRQARPGGVVVGGYYMPEGTVLGISHYAMYHNARNFAAAEEFHPERWLGTEPRFQNDRKDAFQPFSYGPRNCIGRYLANAEMRTILSRIIWNFDLEICDDSRDWDGRSNYAFWEKKTLHVTLKERAAESTA